MGYALRAKRRRTPKQIFRPSVLGTTIYVFLFSITVIWILHASNRTEYTDHICSPFYAGLSLYQIVSLVNIAWFSTLVVDFGLPDAPLYPERNTWSTQRGCTINSSDCNRSMGCGGVEARGGCLGSDLRS